MNLTKVCRATVMWAMLMPPVMAAPLPSLYPTPAEVVTLPDYCQARFGKDENVRKAYSQKLGLKNYQHIHHHCIGLNLVNRARVTFDKKNRNFFLQSAVGQFNYVLTRWPPDFALTAEAMRGKGTAEMLLKSAS